MGFPNFYKAMQTTARNQAGARLARIACALERYRLSHHEYPKTLEALAPRYIESLPRDPIGNQPFKYRNAGEEFVLYSVGWNERDDNGTRGESFAQGDWVWD